MDDFAERGSGVVQSIGGGIYVLFVSPYVVRLTIDVEANVAIVHSVGRVA